MPSSWSSLELSLQWLSTTAAGGLLLLAQLDVREVSCVHNIPANDKCANKQARRCWPSRKQTVTPFKWVRIVSWLGWSLAHNLGSHTVRSHTLKQPCISHIIIPVTHLIYPWVLHHVSPYMTSARYLSFPQHPPPPPPPPPTHTHIDHTSRSSWHTFIEKVKIILIAINLEYQHLLHDIHTYNK